MALQQAGLEWVNEGLSSFTRDLQRGNEAMAGVGEASEQSSGKINLLSGVITGVSTAITTTLIDAVKGASQAVIGLAKDSIGMATDFESAATRLKIAGTGAATQAGIALEDLSEAALAVGGDTRLLGVSATGAAESFTELLKAGLPLEDVMGDFNAYMSEGAELGGVLRGAIDLAAATELDMVEASSLAATSMTIFGFSADEVTDKLDYMVRGADASVADVSDLRDALEGAGPTLRGFGFTIEDSVDALSLLSNAGITGAEAGTALRSAWTQMTSDKDKVTGALYEQGIALTDANGEFLSFRDTMAQLQVATENMTEAQRSEFLQTIAGTYGKTALTALLDQGIEGYEEYAVALENAAGIEQQSTENSKTLASAQEALDGTLETIKIRIGTALVPTLNTMTGVIANLADRYSPMLISAFEWVGRTLEGFVGIITTTADEGGLLLDYFDLIPTSLQPIAEIIGGVILAFQDFRNGVLGADYPWEDVFPPEVADRIYAIIDTFQNVQAWILQNWPLVRDTVLGVFNAIQEWVDANWPTIQAVILTAWEVIKSTILAVVETLRPTLAGLFEPLSDVQWDVVVGYIKVLGKALAGLAAVIGSVLVGALSGIVGLINGVTEAFSAAVESFNDVVEDIQKVFEGFAEKDIKKIIKNLGKLMVDGFKTPFKIIIQLVKGFVTGVIDFFKNLSKQLVGSSIIPDMMKDIQKVIESVLDDVLDFINNFVDSVIAFFTDLKKNILDLWDTLWKSIKTTTSSAIDAVEGYIDGMVSTITKTWDSFVDDVETAWNTLWDNVKTKTTTIIEAIKTALTTWIESIKMLWSTFAESLTTTWNTLWDNFSTGLADKFESIKSAVATGIQGMLDTISARYEDFKTYGQETINKVREGIEAVASTLGTAIQTALTNMVTAAKQKYEEIKTIGNNIVTKIKEGFEAIWSSDFVEAVKTKLSGLKDALSSVWVNVMNVGNEIVNKIKDGLEGAWYKFKEGIKSLIESDDTGILSAVASAASSIIKAGGEVLNYLQEGIANGWDAFVEWLKQMLDDIFPGSEPKNPNSPFRSTNLNPMGEKAGKSIIDSIIGGMEVSMPAFNEQLATSAMPVYAGAPVTTITNSRSVSVEVNPTYTGMQSESSIYYDVQAALAGATQ